MPATGTSPRAAGLRGVMFLLALVIQINRKILRPATEPGCRHPGVAGTLLLLRWFHKAKMTWSPPPVLRCGLVRGFEGFGQVLLLVGNRWPYRSIATWALAERT
jgi:hypothetical protein